MSPDDIALVDYAWSYLRCRRVDLDGHLRSSFAVVDAPHVAALRADWLFDAIAELVGLLRTPSRLADRARCLATTRPVAAGAPSFGVEGRAWMNAAAAVCPFWTDETEQAWRHAWLLLSDVLAEEALSPFAPSPPSP